MIKISDIEPIDRKSKYKKVANLETDYLGRLRINTKPEDKLEELIKKKKRSKTKKSARELAALIYLKKEFPNSLILGTPKDLYQIIRTFHKRSWQSLVYKNKKSTTFGKQILEVFGYSKRFRSQVKRGIWLAEQLNIKVCPYCNAQSTIVASATSGKKIAKFQFDHFFSKDQYPYLSISLYNLIPSCANCNITKSYKNLDLVNYYNPYFSDFSIYFKFHLKYNPDPKKLNISQVSKQNLEIELVAKHPDPNHMVSKHNDLYHLKGVYNRHQDIAEDLLVKAIIYTNGLISGHLKIKGLFPDRSTYLRYLISAYPDSKDLLKRPLTKFTQDIAKQLKLY